MARIDDLCDMAVAVIQAAADVTPIDGTNITVQCDDSPEEDTGTMPAGLMRVCVSWTGYADEGPANRREDITDHTLVFLVDEVYGEPGKVSVEWRRIRTDWVDRCIIQALGNARDRLDGAYAYRLDDVSFGLEELDERKAFWVGISITFRDVR